MIDIILIVGVALYVLVAIFTAGLFIGEEMLLKDSKYSLAIISAVLWPINLFIVFYNITMDKI